MCSRGFVSGSSGYGLYGSKDFLSITGDCNRDRSGRSSGPKRPGLWDDTHLPVVGSNVDAVIASINQRLNVLSQLEGAEKDGNHSNRFDQYTSFSSRLPSLVPRDLFRSDSPAFGCGPGRPAFGARGSRGGKGCSYGPAKVQIPRDAAPGPTWTAEPLSQGMSRTGSHGYSRRQDLPSVGRGYRGFTPGGQSKLPSLLSGQMSLEAGPYQLGPSLQNLSGRRHWRGHQGRLPPCAKETPQPTLFQVFHAHFPTQQHPKVPKQNGSKKRDQKAAEEGKEPEVKKLKTEPGAEEPSEEPAEMNRVTQEHRSTVGAEVGEPAEAHTLTMQEETEQVNEQLQGKRPPQQSTFPKMKKRRGFLERVMFTCSICKFRSFYKEDMAVHLESKFHKEHFHFLSSQLPKSTTDFLQEYLQNKFKKMELRWKQTEKLSATICQVYQEQDLTREVGMEHFLRKVEAAHCAICDLFIPMQHHLIQGHLRSSDHNYNCKFMMEQSKRSGLLVARSILNHKVISKKLESYLKGENPFAEGAEDKDLANVTATEEQKDGNMSKVDPTKGAVEETDGQKEHKEGKAETCEGELGEENKGANGFLEDDDGLEGVLRKEDDEGLEEVLGEDEDVEGFRREVDDGVLAGAEGDGDIIE